MSRAVRPVIALLLFGTLLLATGGALAQKKAPAPGAKHHVAVSAKTCPPTTKPGEAELAEAMSHFEKGLQLYSETALEASLVEFERAFQLAPSYRILYNLAQIHRGLNNFAESLINFERYLYCGGDEVAPDRRQEVEKEIASLKPRVGALRIVTNVRDAQLAVDDIPVGTSPMTEQVIVNPGNRKVSVSKAGYIPSTRVVRVVGLDQLEVKLDLTSLKVERDKPTDPGPRNRALVAWGATAVLTTAAVIIGLRAISENKDLDDAKTEPNQDPDDLDSRKDKVKRYSLIADVLGGAAVVAGGVAVYFTVRAANAGSEKPAPGANTGFRLSPSISVSGRF